MSTRDRAHEQYNSNSVTQLTHDPALSSYAETVKRAEEMHKPRYLGDVFLGFVVVAFVAGLGSILGLTLYAARVETLLPVFAGPTYLFFILAGSRVGYIVNRRRCSRAAPWIWILPTIWSAHAAAGDLSGGIHQGDNVLGYIWNTLILGNHELALISQWIIAAPVLTSLAYSFGAWLAIRRALPA